MNNKFENKKLDKKNALWYTIGLGLYCFTSLIFLIIVTRINGVDDAGIFSFGFSFATMIQMIATYAGRTFQVTEQNKEIWDIDFLIFKFITSVTMIIFGCIFCISRSYDLYKFLDIILLILYKALDAYSESIFGIFQKNNNLWQCGVSMTIKSSLCTLIFLITDYLTQDLLSSTFALFITDAIIFIMYDINLLNKYKIAYRFLSKKAFKYLLFAGFSVFIVSFLTQYILMAQKYVIDFIMNHESQAIFGIIVMPATFVSMCAVMIINPFLYKLNKAKINKDYSLFNKIAIKITVYVLVIGVITLIAAFFIGIPILNIIYGIDLGDYLWALMIIIIGSIAAALVAVISNTMITLRKNISQMVIYILASLFSLLISYILINFYGIYGAAFAFCISMMFLLLSYIIIYNYIIRKLKHSI